jgi:hypothetical protein
VHQFSLISDAPSLAHVLSIVGPAVQWAGELLVDEGRWRTGQYVRCYYPNASTTGVIVGWEPGQLSVRIPPLATADDHRLGLHTIRTLARTSGLAIHHNRGYARSVLELDEEFGAEWIHRTVASTAADLVSYILRERSTAMVQGTTRKVYLDELSVRPLVALEPDALIHSLHEQVRRVLYPNPALHQPHIMYVPTDQQSIQAAVWSPGAPYFFPDVATYMLAGTPVRWLRRDVALKEGLVQRIDAVHCTAKAITLDDWPDFLRRIDHLCTSEPAPE